MRDNNPFIKLPIMQGENLLLRPLQTDDAEALYQAASDPLIWQQHPDPTRYQREQFNNSYLAGALSCGSSLLAVDRKTQQIVGCSRYYDWHPQMQEVAIGFTFLVRSHWGGASNRELKKLMLDYAFDAVNAASVNNTCVEKVWFHIGKENWRSRKGTEKIGAVFSHQAIKEINGQQHEYAYYCITRADYVRAQQE